MPAEAGIQLVGDNKIFKDLDSRFCGNDAIFPITTQSLAGEGVGEGGVQKQKPISSLKIFRLLMGFGFGLTRSYHPT